MKTTKKWLASFLVLALAVCVIAPTASAAMVMPRGSQSKDYAIAQGSGKREWNGKDNDGFWTLTRVDTRWFVSITTPETRSIKADLRYVITAWPDSTIKSLELTGSNGDYNNTGYFIPANNASSHYAVISTENPDGVAGKTTVIQ